MREQALLIIILAPGRASLNFNISTNKMTSPLDAIYNYRRVDESLATSGQPSESQLQAIAEAGYEVVINLALHDAPRYSLPNETAFVQGLGMKYIHIPVQFASPTNEDLVLFFETMKTHSSCKIWVHCAANWRVTTFLGLFRQIVQGWSHEEAFKLHRPLGSPMRFGLLSPAIRWLPMAANITVKAAPARGLHWVSRKQAAPYIKLQGLPR